MLLALLLALGPGQSDVIPVRQDRSLDGGRTGWAVECLNCGSVTATVSTTVNVNIVDAGPPINVNFPTTLATTAKQDTGNTSLSSIDTKLTSVATVAVMSQLLDGGVVIQVQMPSGVSRPASATEQGVQYIQPLPTNQFLPKCTNIRRSNCR